MSIPPLECRPSVYTGGLTFPFAILFWCFFFTWHVSIKFSPKGTHSFLSSVKKIRQFNAKAHLDIYTSASEINIKHNPKVYNPQGYSLIKTGCEGYLISDFNIGYDQPSEPSPGQHTTCVLKSCSPSHSDFTPVLFLSQHSVQNARIDPHR